MRSPTLKLLFAVAAVCAGLLAGCGGSGKPAFCGDLSSLQKSVTGINVSGGVSSLKTQLGQIQTDAKNVVSSAKSDFPDQTAAINSSVTKLQASLKAIPSSPTPQQLATVASDIKAVVDAVNSFVSASKSKCD